MVFGAAIDRADHTILGIVQDVAGEHLRVLIGPPMALGAATDRVDQAILGVAQLLHLGDAHVHLRLAR